MRTSQISASRESDYFTDEDSHHRKRDKGPDGKKMAAQKGSEPFDRAAGRPPAGGRVNRQRGDGDASPED